MLFGDSLFALRLLPRPEPKSGEVLIRVHASGVNPVDWKIREGYLKDMLRYHLPLVLGWDGSGTVEAAGAGVTRLKTGDEVYSRPDITRDGTYAEFVVIKELEVAPKPKSVDHIQAAAIPLAALTAWQALFDAGGLAPGQAGADSRRCWRGWHLRRATGKVEGCLRHRHCIGTESRIREGTRR